MSAPSTAAGIRGRWQRLVVGYERFAVPGDDGLPRLRVLLAFPAVLLVLGAILVGLGLNGSSSGAYYPEISTGSDPDLVAGEPQRIRSDEWNVGTVWTIAQVEQGLPAENQTVPGGMDADLPYDLPSTSPSMVFKPHLWGFLVLDVDHAVAWKWWVPGLALLAAAYLFAVTMLPRRPGMAATIATGFFFSPFVQWWYQTTTLWPLAWGLVAITAILWGIGARRRLARWFWAIPFGYVTVVMAMGVYAPFIVPVAYVVVFAAIGVIIQALRSGMRVTELLSRALPVAVGGVAGILTTLLWLRLKADTVNGFLSTVYPGERLSPTGEGNALGIAQYFAASFSQALVRGSGFLGLNSSEASTFFFVGVVLIPVVIWISIRRRRDGRQLPWLALALVAVVVLFAAWLLIPGWDAISHLLALDRTTAARMRIGFGLASLALLVVVIREGAESAAPRLLAGILAAGYLVSQVAVAVAVVVVLDADRLWGDAPLWWLIALVTSVAVFALARNRPRLGVSLLLIVSVVATVGVHPVYRGVLDLRETEVSTEVRQLDDAKPAAWVGVGGSFVGAVLLESGVRAYNGTQGAPSHEMWDEIDPDGAYEPAWNRIGAVRWEPGSGEPTVANPAPDVILSTFDACSDFAQQNVAHVLADLALSSPCLSKVESFTMPKYTVTIYDVVPAS